MDDWHPQDWLLVAEALTAYAGGPRALDEREARAWELVDDIANEQDLPVTELIEQVDDDWPRSKSEER